jgi:hypothetical protein
MEPSQRRIGETSDDKIRSPQGPEYAGDASENGGAGNLDNA